MNMLEQCELAGGQTGDRAVSRAPNDPMAYLDDVVRYAYARLGSREEAEDVAMEVFQAAFRLRAELPKKLDPRRYLIGIARRKIADHLRGRNKQRGTKTMSLDAPLAAEPAYELDRGLSDLIEALDGLPELQRDVLVLKHLLGFSTLEVAAFIKKSPQAANSLLQRGRETLLKSAPHLIPTRADYGSER